MIGNRREKLMGVFRRFWSWPDSARIRPGESFSPEVFMYSANSLSFSLGASSFLTWLAMLKQFSKHLPVMNHRLHMTHLSSHLTRPSLLPAKLETHVSPGRSLNLGKGDVFVTALARSILFF